MNSDSLLYLLPESPGLGGIVDNVTVNDEIFQVAWAIADLDAVI